MKSQFFDIRFEFPIPDDKQHIPMTEEDAVRYGECFLEGGQPYPKGIRVVGAKEYKRPEPVEVRDKEDET